MISLVAIDSEREKRKHSQELSYFSRTESQLEKGSIELETQKG